MALLLAEQQQTLKLAPFLNLVFELHDLRLVFVEEVSNRQTERLQSKIDFCAFGVWHAFHKLSQMQEVAARLHHVFKQRLVDSQLDLLRVAASSCDINSISAIEAEGERLLVKLEYSAGGNALQ